MGADANEDILPILQDSRWFEVEEGLQRCTSFPECELGLKCRNSHVYIPLDEIKDFAFSPDTFWRAYETGLIGKRFSSREIHDSFCFKWRTAENNAEYCTAIFSCPMTHTIYYAKGLKGEMSEQEVWWYSNERHAESAVIAVVIDDLKRKFDFRTLR